MTDTTWNCSSLCSYVTNWIKLLFSFFRNSFFSLFYNNVKYLHNSKVKKKSLSSPPYLRLLNLLFVYLLYKSCLVKKGGKKSKEEDQSEWLLRKGSRMGKSPQYQHRGGADWQSLCERRKKNQRRKTGKKKFFFLKAGRM